MARRTNQEIIAFLHETRASLFEMPVRLRDIRAKAASMEEFAGNNILKRSILGEVVRTVGKYYPLPEMIALYRRTRQVYRDHVASGALDGSHDKAALIGDTYGLCQRWLKPGSRYPYGDVRLLRPIISEVLIASADWPRSPYPEESSWLGEWYEELAPGGSLYPDDEHLDYVARFEAFAEKIVWDSRGQEFITIRNFPAPPEPQPLTEWWCTQHLVD